MVSHGVVDFFEVVVQLVEANEAGFEADDGCVQPDEVVVRPGGRQGLEDALSLASLQATLVSTAQTSNTN